MELIQNKGNEGKQQEGDFNRVNQYSSRTGRGTRGGATHTTSGKMWGL